jgi:hypothetical protein
MTFIFDNSQWRLATHEDFEDQFSEKFNDDSLYRPYRHKHERVPGGWVCYFDKPTTSMCFVPFPQKEIYIGKD